MKRWAIVSVLLICLAIALALAAVAGADGSRGERSFDPATLPPCPERTSTQMGGPPPSDDGPVADCVAKEVRSPDQATPPRSGPAPKGLGTFAD